MWDLQGVQCDFDDGFCPTYRNVLQAVHNITLAATGSLTATQPNGRTVRHPSYAVLKADVPGYIQPRIRGESGLGLGCDADENGG